MLKSASLFLLLCLVGCATKLRTPLNRMVSPETVGGIMNPEFEISSVAQSEATIDNTGSDPKLDFATNKGMGYYAALAMSETVDLTWSHSASAPSLVGFKWQFMGGSLRSAGSGHSMALTAGFGGNEHELEGDTDIEFESSATDAALIHGYWFTPFWQVFETLGFSRYSMSGELSGTETGKFADDGTHITLAAGSALVFRPYKLKVEAAYTRAAWSEAGTDTYLSIGMAFAAFF